MAKEPGRYYIAVDGGASKTHFCLHNIDTGSEQEFFSSGTNFKNPETSARKNLIDKGVLRIFTETGISPEEVRGMVMGLAGCDCEDDHRYFMQLAAHSGIAPERIYVGNDCELAFYSKGSPPGLSIVAGTGSIAVGIAPNGEIVRSGGWGSLVSDEGSGLWLASAAARELLHYCDGLGEYQDIFEVLRRHFGEGGFASLPARLSKCGVKELAGLAKPLMDEADRGDDYCAKLVARAAGLVAALAHSVYSKLGFSAQSRVDVVLIGSLFKSVLFRACFRREMAALTKTGNMNFIDGASPVMGGIEMARRLFGGGEA